MYGDIQPQEGAGAPRHSPDVSLRGAKRRGNLGKALPIYTECRRMQSLSNLTVAALSERHGGLQYAPHCPMAQGYQICHCEERSDVAISQNPTGQQGSHRRNRNCLPEIATAPLGPRNDKLEGLAPQNACRTDCQPARRSLSAATDAIGTCYFIDALYGLQMPSRDCHVGLRPPRNDKPLVSTILTAACTGCKCLPEIATSAYGLLAMTNLWFPPF